MPSEREGEVVATATSATERSVESRTMADMLLGAAQQHEGPALKFQRDGEWTEISYAELGEHVKTNAKGLLALGIEPGDRVAILGETSPEWTLADLAALCIGAVVAPIYHTNSPDECRHVLEDSGAKLVFCEDAEQLGKIEEIKDDVPEVEHLVVFSGEDSEQAMSLNQLASRGEEVDDERFEELARGVDPDDLMTLIYTSGTTGPPKGCMVTHGNYRANCTMLEEAIGDLGEDPVFFVFLPLAHTLTRMTQMLALDVGGTLAYWDGDKDNLIPNLRDVKPTHFPAVPRIFEKIYSQARSRAEGGVKEKLFEKAIDAGRQVRELERRGESPGPVLKKEYELADSQVLSNVRDLFGGEVRLALTGAAPVAKELLEFFDACGVLVLEGYGATETSAVATANTPDEFRFGTVGKAVPDSEVKIGDAPAEDDEDSGESSDDGQPSGEEGDQEDADEDEEEEEADTGGEILVRGPHVFKGYYQREEETKEALDDDGWFHTGDLGRLDEDGFLSITGRTKDIIVTSSGKNITPSNIENAIKDSRWISEAVVYGDDRPYLVALVTLDEDEADDLAEQVGVDADLSKMADDDKVREEIEKAIEKANQEFSRIEQVKKFTILDRELSQDEGELTPTMKVKRNVVYEREEERFDALYDDGDSD
jgi:long-chain acyl-CoA synthetase